MKPLYQSRIVNRLSRGMIKWGWWTSSYQSDSAPIIIGGCGRSGTTLLRAMLNAHNRIAIGPETGVFCGATCRPQLAADLQLPLDVVERDYRRSCCLGEFVELLMQRTLQKARKERWGEKSPCNVRCLKTIFQFFPQARFIHMVRDGRDVVASLRTHPKYCWRNGERVPTGICNPWTACVARWVNDVNAGLPWRGDDRYLEVRYERLAAEPEETLRGVLNWLGEDWDDAVINFYESHDERGSDVANPGVMRPVYGSALDRWRKELTEEAISAFNVDAVALLMRLGYTHDESWKLNDSCTH